MSSRTTEKVNLEALKAFLESLVAERHAIDAHIEEVEQQILDAVATFKIGHTIEWTGYRGKVHRAVVRSYRKWCGDVAYGVQRLRKDGSPGASQIVYPYDKPRASTVAYVPEERS